MLSDRFNLESDHSLWISLYPEIKLALVGHGEHSGRPIFIQVLGYTLGFSLHMVLVAIVSV